jgi:hypothetical protein
MPDVRYVELYGEGEPFLNPRFFELAGTVTGRGLRPSVSTNGSLDPDRFRAVCTGKLGQVLEGIRRLPVAGGAERNATARGSVTPC